MGFSVNLQEISLFIHLKQNRATGLIATNQGEWFANQLQYFGWFWAGEQVRQHRADDKLIMQI